MGAWVASGIELDATDLRSMLCKVGSGNSYLSGVSAGSQEKVG